MKIIRSLTKISSTLSLLIDITLTCISQIWLWPCTLTMFCYHMTDDKSNWQYIRASINPFILFFIITNNWLHALASLIALALPSIAIRYLIMPGIGRHYVTLLFSPISLFTLLIFLEGLPSAQAIVNIPTVACSFIAITIYSYIGRPDDRWHH